MSKNSLSKGIEIICYNLKLERLTYNDIELVRKWRNHRKINSLMQFRGYITKHQQAKWFDSIDNKLNYYFLIKYNNEKIGLINAKNVDPSSGLGEGGIFIWEEKYWGTPIPVLASVVFIDAIFNHFKVSDKSIVTVLSKNTKAVNYNLALGYSIIASKAIRPKLTSMLLTREDFNKRLPSFVRLFETYFKKRYALIVHGNSSEKNLPVINSYLDKLK